MQGCLESLWGPRGILRIWEAPCNTFVAPLTLGAWCKLPLLPPLLVPWLHVELCVMLSSSKATTPGYGCWVNNGQSLIREEGAVTSSL